MKRKYAFIKFLIQKVAWNIFHRLLVDGHGVCDATLYALT